MSAFEDFVNTELPLRVSVATSPGAVRYPRFTGVGKAVEARTAAQFLADIGGQGSATAVTAAATLTANVIPVGDGARGLADNSSGVTLVGNTLTRIGQFNSASDDELLQLISAGGSAINFLQISNHVAGNNPIIAATGDDTDVGITFNTKAAGTLDLNADTNVTGDLGVTGTVDGIDIATDVAANTAKVTNATHTGDVTGSGALAIDPTGISGKSLVTAVTGDMVLLWDASDSLLKRANVSDFGGGGSGDVVGPGSATNNAFARFDTTTGKLIQDSKLLGADVGVSGSLTDLLTLVNDVSGTSGTETSILYQQEDSGATLRDAGRITVGVEQAWTATASTRDSFLAFHTSRDGAISENMRIHSSGRVVIHDSDEDPTATTVEFLSVLNIGSSCGMGAYAYRNTVTGTAFFSMNRARESGGAKAALVDNDNIARFFARGWDGAAWRSPGRLDWLVDGAVSSGVMPIEFRVITGSSGSGTTRMTFRAAGGIEVASSQTMTFNGASNSIQGGSSSNMTIQSPTLVLNATTQLLLEKSGDVRFEATATSTNLRLGGSVFFDVRSVGIGFNGASAMAQPDYTITNPTTNRSIDVSGITHADLAQVVGTLLQDLIDYGLLQ